jgi:hypothetical protein
MVMENINENTDPGAKIETVIPSTEKEEPLAKSPDESKEEISEKGQERVGAGDNADDIEPKDKPEITEEEKDKPEVSENEGGESKPDDHGIETISP